MQVCWTLMSLCFQVLQQIHYQIFCVTYILIWMFVLNNLFCCLQVLHRFYSLSFPLCFHTQPCSSIWTTFFHLCHHFFLLLFFCVLNSTYGFNHCDWLNSNRRCIFLVSILILSKVVSCHDESHIFLYQKKLGPNLLKLPIYND